MEHRATTAIESDIRVIESFAASYRAYWGVRADGGDREAVKDRISLRNRLHRQLPRVEKIMVSAGTNGFGFAPPPIARGAPPRLGVVAVAFADEDPVYSVGGGPPCFEEVLNRLEMTLGVLETELQEAETGSHTVQPTEAPRVAPSSTQKSDPASKSDEESAGVEQPLPVRVVEAAPLKASPAGVFAHGVRRAWSDARAAGASGSLRGKIEIAAAIATIIGTVAGLGVLFGWWGA